MKEDEFTANFERVGHSARSRPDPGSVASLDAVTAPCAGKDDNEKPTPAAAFTDRDEGGNHTIEFLEEPDLAKERGTVSRVSSAENKLTMPACW